MKILILFLFLNPVVKKEILNSSIPCKILFLKQSLWESNHHKNKLAIKYNNYSGFRYKKNKKYRLIKFKSIKHYIKYSERFFKRKKICNCSQFEKYILAGKYSKTKNHKKYLKNVKKIRIS